MTENTEERVPLPSLVADDLVDLVRRSLVEIPEAGHHNRLVIDFERDDGSFVALPLVRTDGRPVALDFAMIELLVEIRDAVSDSASRLSHVHAADPRPRTLAVPVDEAGEIDVDLERTIRETLSALGWLDAGRIAALVDPLAGSVRRAILVAIAKGGSR